MQLKPYGYAPVFGPLALLYLALLYGLFILGLYVAIKIYRTTKSAERKKQAAYFSVGISCALLGGVGDSLPVWGVPFYPTGIFGNILLCLFIALAILKYHLLDINVVIRKGLAYGIISTLVFGFYVGILTLVIMTTPMSQVSPWLSAVIVILLAAVFHPMLERVQRLVDKLFYRERYDYLRALEQFSQETKDISNIKSLVDSLLNLVSQAMLTTKSCLLVPDHEKKYFYSMSCHGLLYNHRLTLASNGILANWLSQHEEVLERKQLDILPQLRAITVKERAVLDQIEAELIIALKTDKGLAAILILGPKRSEELYDDNDMKLLRVMTRQVAINLDNARLYQESKQAQRELEMAQERLIQSEKLKALGEMSSGIAHDFNNVLTSILGRVQLALRDVQDAKLKRNMEIIEQGALDAAQMVQRLQDVTRVRTDHSFELADLNQILEAALENIKPRLNELLEIKDIRIQVSFDRSDISPVEGSASELREVLTNILLNAIEAMPSGGGLTLKSQQENHLVAVTVSDTGVGMSAEVKKKLFTPFFTTKGSKGLGMGLSVAYGIINRHSAKIEVFSKPGEGSTFTIKFPVTKRGKEQVISKAPQIDIHTASILVIDDDEAARQVISETLNRVGHKVDMAVNGQQGLSLAQRKVYDLVVTDLGMPDISGRQVAKAIKSANPVTPVLLITGWGVQLDPIELEKDGVDGLIAKPFNIDEILTKVAKLLSP